MPALRSFSAAVSLVALLALAAPGSSAEPAASDFVDLPWSFAPLVPPAVPQVADQGWCRDDVDRFVFHKRQAAGLQPSPDASRATLLRRLAQDLTGLPPTQKELDAFLSDPSSDDQALARAADKYLASPHFGERWGRHWLDVVRYADSTGRAWNAPLTYAWRYRDWVIDALNADKPYDRFLAEQIAGDLSPAESLAAARSQRIATGLLALGATDLQTLSHEQFVLDVVDDQIDVITRAVLGLSVSCARCHDHKYDPITMRDYYALAGVFYSTRTLPGVAHQRESGGEGYVHPSKLVTLPTASGQAYWPPGVHSMSDYQDQWRQGSRRILFATSPDLAVGVAEDEPRDCELRIKGEPYQRGAAPPRGDLRIPGLPRLPAVAAPSSGRLELARWLTAPDQPLTPRVIVNRVWQHLFGAGLVRTVDDFGVNSERPVQAELLDHLATRLRSDGWSLKRLIRALVLSRTYRQSTAGSEAGWEQDPQNALYWRMNRRRLELEPLRDALLDLAGRLSLDRPAGIQVSGIGGKSRQSQVASLLPFNCDYRTVYLPVIRAGLPEEFSAFDFPDPCLLQGEREVTTVAPQALFFLNNDFVVDCARSAARRMLEVTDNDRERVVWIYRRTFSRLPEPEETSAALAFLGELRPAASERDAELYRWTALIQGLVASAEFRYLR